MVQMRRQVIKLYGKHAIIQALRSINDAEGEAVRNSFDQYRDALMPYMKKEIEKEHKAIVAALKEETGRGPFSVKPVEIFAPLSQLKSKLQGNKIRKPRAVWKRKGKRS